MAKTKKPECITCKGRGCIGLCRTKAPKSVSPGQLASIGLSQTTP